MKRCLTAIASLPTKNIKELIAFIRARPGQIQLASAGLGSAPHLMMELFRSMAGLKMIVVPGRMTARNGIDSR